MSDLILHITPSDSWAVAQKEGVYRGDTLESEGFIHTSTPEQIVRTANKFYHGRSGLLLLCIDARRVKPILKWEPPSPGADELFPHIYGPLNLDAVIHTLAYEPRADGTFDAPDLSDVQL
jgi:uncharacterized protein (DUF952 family)